MTWASESSHLDRTRFAHRANLHRSTCPSRRRKFLTPFTGCLPAPMYTTHVRGAFLPAHSPPSPPSPSPPPCRSLRAEAAAANSVWLLSKDPNNFEQGTSRNRSEEKRMWRGKESAEMREGNCFCYYISCKRYSFPFSPPPPTLSLGLSGKRGARTDGRALGPLPSTLHTFLSLFCTAEKILPRFTARHAKKEWGRKKKE